LIKVSKKRGKYSELGREEYEMNEKEKKKKLGHFLNLTGLS